MIWSNSFGAYAVNVLGGRKAGAATIDQGFANTLGAAIKSALTSSGQVAQIGTLITLTSVGVRDISAPSLPEFMDAGAAVPGTAAGNLLPSQIAMCFTLRTAKAGKNYRGRSYLSGYTVGALTAGGAAVAGVGTAGVAFLTAIKTAMTTSGLAMAIVSRELHTTEDVTLIQSRDATWETQRRRAIAGI